MLDREIIDKLWNSGYCPKSIKLCGWTEQGRPGTSARKLILTNCVKDKCEDCTNANVLRNLEGDVAMLCGQESFGKFLKGEEFEDHPKYADALSW